MRVLPANFEKSTRTSARSAGASSSECLSTLPKSNRVGLVIHVVGCWPSMTAGAGRNPASLAIWIQSGPAVDAFWTGVGNTVGSVWAASSCFGLSATSVLPLPWFGSATYHWKLKDRSFAAFSIRSRYVFGDNVTFG